MSIKIEYSYADLEIDDPYNTYIYKGLPPGPIAGAGKSSIEAVIDPARRTIYYFLADKKGVNHFTDSYEQHLKNRKALFDQETDGLEQEMNGMDNYESYIASFVKEKDPFIVEMEQYAEEHHVPIMDSDGIDLFISLLRIQNPRTYS